MWLLAILTILTFAFVIGLIMAIKDDEEKIAGTCLAFLLVIIMFGWVLMGNIFPVREETINYNGKLYVVKTPSTVYVESEDGKIKEKFTSAKNYNEINDSTKFIIRKQYNMYGEITNTYLEVKPKEVEEFLPEKK